MATLWLTYGARTAAIEDGEAAWDDRTSGDVTCTADSSIYMVGTKSAKMVTTDTITPSTKLASEAITSADLSSYTHIALWVRSNQVCAAGDFQLMLDDTADCASPIETINLEAIPVANQWYRQILPLATPASCTAIISIGLKAGAPLNNGWAIYIDDVVPVVAKSFAFYGIRGLYEPDEISMYPGIKIPLLDGSVREHISAFSRIISLDMAPISTKADRLFLAGWGMSEYRYIVYLADDVRVVLDNPESFVNEWVGGVEVFRRWSLRCQERSARTTNPLSWGYTI